MTKKQTTKPVFSLQSLIANPEFTMPVELEHPAAGKIKVEMTVKALRKSEWAALRDEHIKGAGDADTDAEFSFVRMISESTDSAAELVMKFAVGWNLEDDLTAGNLIYLDDLCGGALVAILGAYDAAVFQGRLGNSKR